MLPVTVKLGSGSESKDVTLVGTYFNKPLHFGKQDFTLACGSRTRGGKSRVGTGDSPVQGESKTRQQLALANDDSQTS